MKELSVIIFSSFKFAMTFPLAIMEYKMGIFKTLLWTNIGGLAGIIFFTYLSDILINIWKKHMEERTKKFFGGKGVRRRKKRIFTRRNRRIIRIRSRFGLAGISLATPVILSIPVGAFLVVRYFGKKPGILAWLVGANLIWSLIYALFYTYIFEVYLRLFA